MHMYTLPASLDNISMHRVCNQGRQKEKQQIDWVLKKITPDNILVQVFRKNG